MKMTPGKYVNHKFTADQRRARAIWDRAHKEQLAINDALMVINWGSTREELHARLDRRLDVIERSQARAREIFPDVSESYTIASGVLVL